MPKVIRINDTTELVPTRLFPYAKFQFEYFNPVQSGLFHVYDQETNYCLAASTSAGKTACCEMLLSHEVRHRGGKGMYIAPLKALAQEKIDDWRNDPKHHFADLNLSICTGDYILTKARQKELNDANLILMTSEMLASYTYNTEVYCHQDGRFWMDKIGRIVEEDINCEVMSYHQGKGVLPTPVTAKMKIPPKEAFRVTLEGGRSVEMTADHNMMIQEGDSLKEVMLKDIAIGDRVAISAGFKTLSQKSQIDILNVVRHIGSEKQQTLFICGRVVDRLMKMTIDELVKYCSLTSDDQEVIRTTWRSQGCVPVSQLTSFFWSTPELVDGVESIGFYHSDLRLPRFWDVTPGIARTVGVCTATGSLSQSHVEFDQNLMQCDSVVGVLLDYIFATFGKIPEFVFTWRAEDIEYFLEGFLDGDKKTQTQVQKKYQTCSDELSKGIQNLLLLTGVISSRTNYNGNGYVVAVNPESVNGVGNPNFPGLSFAAVRSIESIGIQDVYDLEVQPEDVYYKIENWVGGQGGIILHNSRCRNKKSEKSNFLSEIGTLVIDESHLLTVPGRGDHLEVAMMKIAEINPNLRICLLSATMPNVEEICYWTSNLTNKNTFLMESSYRPCKLNIHYEKYFDGSRDYDATEAEKISTALSIIEYYKEDKFLVFAHTKRTGELMKIALNKFGIDSEFHNADLAKDKRCELERRFKEDHNFRVIVATSTLAWGLNLPARRVVILGVHRGMGEVATYDISQMVGRAGRPKYDPAGDAYILLPEGKFEYHKHRLQKPARIESQLLEYVGGKDEEGNLDETRRNYKTLAFHLVSEVHHKTIKTHKDVNAWYSMTLAHHQNQWFDGDIVDSVLDSLQKCGAIKEEDGEFKVTAVGTIASMFYFSPFDVADYKRMFSNMFNKGFHNNDIAVAVALGNIDSYRFGIVSKVEREEMSVFAKRVQDLFGIYAVPDPSIKAAFAYWNLLNGKANATFNGFMRGLQFDFPRVVQVLQAIDTMASKWDQSEWFKILKLRIQYGCKRELVNLCQLPQIGAVRAQRLWDANIRTFIDVATKPEIVKKITNLGQDKINEIVAHAQALRLKEEL